MNVNNSSADDNYEMNSELDQVLFIALPLALRILILYLKLGI